MVQRNNFLVISRVNPYHRFNINRICSLKNKYTRRQLWQIETLQGFGLIPAGTLGQTPATAGLGKYKIDAGYATTLYNGGAVASAAGYIIDGQTTAAPIIGVLNGVFYTDRFYFEANVQKLLSTSNTS